MKFSTREDVNAPIAEVFDALCDFDALERAAMRRGADVRRRSEPAVQGLGTTWEVTFSTGGKERRITVEVIDLRQPEFLTASLSSGGFGGTIGIELIALSRSRTRMVVGFEIRPKSLSARIFIQSLKLTKSKLDAKFRERVALQVQDLENRLVRRV